MVQEFYLPMPEQQINTANNAIISGTSSSILSTFSIVVTASGTVIYYDQWEDGYETDLSNPTQSSTQIWGDGNTNNGVAPGYPNDILPAGAVITLTNTVTQPRNPSQFLWDARDRIAASKALVISRAGWPITPGPVFAGAVGVLSTIDYGTNYISPVGQNVTNNLFKYVGMFIMAAQNNTAVTIDPNGNGVGTTNIVLNQGESYLVNGGVLVGGRVTASKMIQADLIIGHVGAGYASDWFTLYPASEWSSSYYTPVGSAANVAQPAFVYLYNPNTNPINIRYTTKVSSGTVVVAGTNGVSQFQMPVGSGANFATTNGQNFYALCTVAANNTADTAYNWGFTLVPKSGLTTEATVGWGPGSADGTVNGSPVWITALANTMLYVDYKGDHAGPLSYTNGSNILNYDTNFTVTALQSLKIFDPSKNQTGMRVFTVDGTLVAGAWGEDPDTAQPGNPYIDAGTTVIPFPVPVLLKSVSTVTDAPPTGLSLNDILSYSVQINNQGLLPLGNTVVIDAPSGNLSYVSNSTTLNGVSIPDNVGVTNFPLAAPSGYTIPIILSQGSSTFKYQVKVIGGGTVSNSVNIGGTTIIAQTAVPPGITNASLSLRFTDTNGNPVSTYAAGTNVFVTMTNALGNTSSNTIQTIAVTVVDLTSGDLQTITLTETSTNSGVFRNIIGLPTSTTSGIPQQDGILNVAPADTLQVAYTDPVYLDGDTNTASILVPTLNKQLYLTANATPGNQFLNRINPSATAGHGATYTSVDIGSGSSGVVTLDSITTVSNTTSLIATNTHVTTAGANRLMLVGISLNRGTGGTTFETPTNITYAGIPLVQVGGRTNLTSQEAVMWMFALTNPPVGTNDVIVKWDQTQVDGDVIGCATFTGVNQTTPYGTFFSNTNTSTATLTNVSVVVTSAPGELVFDTVALRSQNFGAVGSPGANQTTLWKTYFNSKIASGSSTQPGAVLVTNTWTTSGNNDWVIGAISIKPAAAVAGPGTNNTSFTQTPAFQLPFTMPAGGSVSITNFITITNGAAALAASPNLVTATLRTNGVNFLTLNNTTLAGNTNLIWSGLLASSVTIPTNVAITYVISNNVANSAFHVNYDTTNNSSEIVLPATTVINIISNGVYDAPYPGGNLINSPVAGSTVYLRTAVSDPFGYYDITSLGVNITGPASLSSNLTDANAVLTSGAVKIYEYAVTTGPNTGTYNLAVTANEGTEGVNVSAATSITTTFLDLGTPSITQFTAGPNGVSTNSYPANTTVSVRVSDLNRNTNATTIDTVSVLVTNSFGDYETHILVETGTNTGIFTNSLVVSTNVVGLPSDGILYAPVTSILTVYYSDPTDPTDNTSATATVQPLPGVPGVVMNKTVLSPSGGQVGVSNNITFNLQAVNVGSTTLPSLSFTDTFPTNKLRFVSASLAPNVTNASGILTWTNLGALTPSQSTNITVTFFTLITGATTNFATANGSTATNTSSVTFAINNTALNVTKILLSPTNTPVAVGSNVVFRITVQNTGNVTVNYLPLEDTFSAAYYQFVSSTITNNGSGAGSLIWTNLASPTALVAGATITNDVTMKVVGQGSPANNTATVDYATDINGNPVPTTSSTIGVNTAAGSITGHVYNDLDTNGVLSAGDTPLAGVTLQLFTDPNGDGNPVDGALVQVTTTDASGYYEFLNLNIGHYVIVENHLPGYDSSAPSSNQKAINLPTLTATNNNNFFDFQPSPSQYSTISGRVWNDTNGNGTNDVGETNIANVSLQLFEDDNTNGQADLGEPLMGSATTDASGNYSFFGITPGHYVILKTDPYGYYSTGVSRGTNFNQIVFVSTNGIVSTNNSFYDRLSPIAYPDTVVALYFVATNIYPLTNDVSPNGDPLVITNASSTNGLVVINAGSTNLTFTPTNLGISTITYVIADAHGGTSTNIITVNVTALANVGIGKTAAATVFATSNLSYTISVTNFGPSPASSVVVTDALPAGVTFVSASAGGVSNNAAVTWSLGTLTNNQFTNLTLVVTAPIGGTLTNIASVGSPTPDPAPTNNTSPPVVTGVTPVTDIVVSNRGPVNVVAGTTYTNTISVTNAGPSSATNVVVVDTRPDGSLVTNTIAVLSAGSGTNFVVTYVAPGSGPLTNSATGGSTTYDPNPNNNTNILAVTAVTAAADVGLGKTAAGAVFATSNLSYTISVTNFGPSSASSVVVTDTLPAGVTFVSATAGGISNNGVVSWSLGTLTNNQVTNLTLIVAAPVNGSLTNVASVSTPTGDPNLTNNVTPPVVTSVTPVADVVVSNVAPANVFAGTIYTNTISVTNAGPSAATNVVVVDVKPDGTSVTNAFAVLPAGSGTNFTVTYFAPGGGLLTNSATGSSLTYDPNLGNNTNIVSVTLVMALSDLGIGKAAAATVFATSNLSYTISVTNFGPSSASSVVVTDTLPAGVSFVSATGGGVSNNAAVVWNLGTMTNNQISSLNLIVTAPVSGILTNTVGVSAPTSDPNLTNNVSPPVVTDVMPVADVAIGKTGAAGIVLGTNFTYTISVTNFGPSVATTLAVTDSLPAGISFVGSVPNATTNGSQVIWTNLGNLAVGASTNLSLTVISTALGTVTNIATGGSPVFDSNPTNNPSAPVVTAITNIPPIANPDSYAMSENTTNSFSPLANDVVKTPGGILSIVSVSGTNGVASISGTNVIFVPTTNFIGVATIGYTITDNVGGTNVGLITIAVTNIPPVANPDSYAMSENTTNSFSPLGNDVVNTPGGVLNLVSVSGTNGVASINGTNVVFIPTTNFIGVATIGYTITDNVGGTNVGLITIAVTNIPPVANPDSYAMGANTTNSFSPLANDVVKTPGGILSLVSASGTNGVASISGTNVIFVPTTNFIGIATISYTITDNLGGTNSSLITVTVTNVFTIPLANAQSVTTTENTARPITLTGSDSTSLPLTFFIVTSPTNGALSLINTNTGTVTYTPGTNYVGNDSFTFRVNNGHTNSLPATVSIAVLPVADLAVTQSGPTNAAAGSNLLFTVSVTNRGPATATSLIISNVLAPGFTFVSASGNGSNAGNVVTWSIAALPFKGATNLTVRMFAAEGGTFTNIASGLSAAADLNLTNNNGSLTNARTRTVIAALADVAVFKAGGTNVFAGQSVDYIITATNAGPSTATNVIVQDNLPAGATFQTASGGYALSNGVVRWPGITLAPGTATTFTLTLLAPASVNSFLNIALATSPVADPNPTNNNGSYTKSRVTTSVTPSADVVVLLVGPPTAIQGSNFVYNLTVTNAGPSTSSNLVVSDSLPLGLVFVSASSGGKLTNGVVTPHLPSTNNVVYWPQIKSLRVGASTNYTVTVYSQTVGTFTNVASALAMTYDPNPTNNSGVLPIARVQTEVQVSQFGILGGTPVLNPQTGLYEETATVTNTGNTTILGFRLFVGGLRSGVTLWNANGTNNGVPFINYNFPVDPSNAVSVILEFYNPSRLAFTNTLSAEAILPGDVSNTGTNNSVPVTKVFTDTRIAGDTRFVIEFASVLGKTYAVIYSSDLTATNWNIATPSLKASANVTQWYDDGPPKTVSKPDSVNARFYRVIQY